ncbi:MAG: hypothetical protein ABIL09_17480 [Gemmatimonadota bacterium]
MTDAPVLGRFIHRWVSRRLVESCCLARAARQARPGDIICLEPNTEVVHSPIYLRAAGVIIMGNQHRLVAARCQDVLRLEAGRQFVCGLQFTCSPEAVKEIARRGPMHKFGFRAIGTAPGRSRPKGRDSFFIRLGKKINDINVFACSFNLSGKEEDGRA